MRVAVAATDELFASDEHYLLGRWLSDARALGRSDTEKQLLEWNARTQVTLWGRPSSRRTSSTPRSALAPPRIMLESRGPACSKTFTSRDSSCLWTVRRLARSTSWTAFSSLSLSSLASWLVGWLAGYRLLSLRIYPSLLQFDAP